MSRVLSGPFGHPTRPPPRRNYKHDYFPICNSQTDLILSVTSIYVIRPDLSEHPQKADMTIAASTEHGSRNTRGGGNACISIAPWPANAIHTPHREHVTRHVAPVYEPASSDAEDYRGNAQRMDPMLGL
jgi:hypothetical protein